MKNLKNYTEDSYSFYLAVTNSKKSRKDDPNYKERINSLKNIVEERFQLYKNKFDQNQLEDITSISLDSQKIKDLGDLYNYKSKPLQLLKIKLTTDENNRVNNTCQNCSIGEVNSFDHYLPQSEFAEFIVNPLNLIPSCSNCNGRKNSIWRNNGKRVFLNQYLDTLPSIQYLFVNIDSSESTINVCYYLENKGNIENGIFEKITNHYERLDLLNRFKENSHSIISELDNEIKNFSKLLPINKVIETIVETCNDNRKTFGFNNWKIVLKLALVESPSYLSRFNDSIKKSISYENC